MEIKPLGVDYNVEFDERGTLRPDDALDAIVPKIIEVCTEVTQDGTQIYEGSATPKELSYLIQQVGKFNAPHILEIGMNVGISTVAMLEAAPGSIVVSYDLGEWACARAAARVLRKVYGHRHEVVWGDSKMLLPLEERKFDFAFVDGGHDEDTAYSDIREAARRSKTLMVDDVQIDTVFDALALALSNGFITHVETGGDTTGWVERRWALFTSNVYKG